MFGAQVPVFVGQLRQKKQPQSKFTVKKYITSPHPNAGAGTPVGKYRPDRFVVYGEGVGRARDTAVAALRQTESTWPAGPHDCPGQPCPGNTNKNAVPTPPVLPAGQCLLGQWGSRGGLRPLNATIIGLPKR